jgi:hypothetical protein
MNFDLGYVHNQSLEYIENMIPWERDLYVDQLRQYVEEQNLKSQQAAVESRSYGRR